MMGIANGLNAAGPPIGLSMNPSNLTNFDPDVQSVKVCAQGGGIYQTDAKQAGVHQVAAESAGIYQVDAKQAGVNQVDAEGAGIHQTDAKQVDG